MAGALVDMAKSFYDFSNEVRVINFDAWAGGAQGLMNRTSRLQKQRDWRMRGLRTDLWRLLELAPVIQASWGNHSWRLQLGY